MSFWIAGKTNLSCVPTDTCGVGGASPFTLQASLFLLPYFIKASAPILAYGLPSLSTRKELLRPPPSKACFLSGRLRRRHSAIPSSVIKERNSTKLDA